MCAVVAMYVPSRGSEREDASEDAPCDCETVSCSSHSALGKLTGSTVDDDIGELRGLVVVVIV